jgi:peptidoglycan-associated lipoprotein
MLTHYRQRLGIALAVLFFSAAGARAQSVAPVEVAFGYSYVRANAPPGGCGCFSMNGLNGSLATLLGHNVSVVGEVGGYFRNNVDGSGRSLRVETFLFGPRYSFAHGNKFTPYVQGLFGGTVGSGTLYGVTATTATSSATTSATTGGFSMSAGGGLDWNVRGRLSIRLFQVDYLMTRLPNYINNYQNNIRISAGVVVRLGLPHTH